MKLLSCVTIMELSTRIILMASSIRIILRKPLSCVTIMKLSTPVLTMGPSIHTKHTKPWTHVISHKLKSTIYSWRHQSMTFLLSYEQINGLTYICGPLPPKKIPNYSISGLNHSCPSKSLQMQNNWKSGKFRQYKFSTKYHPWRCGKLRL